MAKNEVKYGAILSYILIIINSFYGLIIMPFVLKTIGESEYGVYKTIAAMTSSVSVLELGIGSTIQRFLAKYNALKDKKNCYNFSAMGLIQASVLSLLMAIVGVFLYFSIERVYKSSFTSAELMRAKQIFVFLILYVVMHIYENVFYGIISGYNKFAFSNSLKIVMLLLKIVLYYIILPIVRTSLAIVIISVSIECIIIGVEYIYVKNKLHHRIRLIKWDNEIFKESFAYTILLFIQSLIIQFNGNIDNIVIGAVIGTSAVTVYSFAIQIFNMYEQCATSISSVILPTVTNQIYNGATSDDLEKTIVKFGRVQWFVLGAALFGFGCFGQEFFSLWLGDKFTDCYYLSLILMIPVTFPLIVNVCLAILKAKNLLLFRTVAMGYSVIFNALFTIIGTRFYGYWAAAIGTGLSTVIGSIISLNVYYQKKLKINVFKLYIKIINRGVWCLAGAAVVGVVLNKFIGGTWVFFGIKACAFLIVYSVLLLLFGLNKEERSQIFRKVKR